GKGGRGGAGGVEEGNLRYALASIRGVAEVASLGGWVRQYQVQVDPSRLLALGIPLGAVTEAVRASNQDVGGRVLEFASHEYVVRGRRCVKSPAALRRI